MTERIVGVGLIGCGDIALTRHVPAIAENASVRLIAVCDTDPHRAEAAAEAGGGAYYTTEYRRLLTDPAIDAVIVCTPPWVTPSITMEALHCGKDVLCEKPMAVDLETAERVVQAEEASGRLLQVGFTYRHGPLMDALHDWIASGRLGRPLQIRVSVFDEVWDPAGQPEHVRRIVETLRHGPPCIHDGAHAADYLAYLTGSRPTRVIAAGMRTRPDLPAPNYNAAVIDYANGDQAKLEIGWLYAHLPSAEFEIAGPDGLAWLDRRGGEAVLVSGSATERIRLGEDRAASCFRVQLAKFADSVVTRRVPVPGSREGLASLRLTKAIAEAIETGLPVMLRDEAHEPSGGGKA
jgi:predicted dehydrogenase